MKKCSICGMEFEPARDWGKYCKSECKEIATSIYQKQYRKKYYQDNKDIMKARSKGKYVTDREGLRERHRKYNASNKEKISKYHKQYEVDNADRLKERRRKHYQNNKDKINAKRKQRRKNSPLIRLRDNTARLVSKAITERGYSKKSKTFDIIGLNGKSFFGHLKLTFESNYNMKWDDRYLDLLHIDHIKPLAKASNEEELLNLNHYTNLQYLWRRHNISKKDKTNWKLIPCKIKEFEDFLNNKGTPDEN